MCAYKQIASVGFDFDHTLTRQPKSRITAAVIESQEEVIHDILSFSIEFYDALKSTYKQLGLGEIAIHARLVSIRNYLRDQQFGITEDAKICLETLTDREIPKFVVSNAPGPQWGKRLIRAHAEHFDQILFSNDLQRPKACPSGILKAISGIPEEQHRNVLYIGNAKSDMQAAIRAGVTPVAMGTNTSAAAFLRAACEENKLVNGGVICSSWTDFSAGLDSGFEEQSLSYT